MNEDLQNAILGGMLSAVKNMADSFNSSGSSSNSTSETSIAPSDSEILSEINNYITSDIWNDGFCDISSYISTGKSSVGQTLDIKFTIGQLDKSMLKLDEYNTKVTSLTDPKFEEAKAVWTKLYPEIKSLYGKIKENTPKPNDSSYEFDTRLFQQYSSAFYDTVTNLD